MSVLGPGRKWSRTEIYAHRKNRAEDRYLQNKLVEIRKQYMFYSAKTIDGIREVHGWIKPTRQHTGHSPWALPPASATSRHRRRPHSTDSMDSLCSQSARGRGGVKSANATNKRGRTSGSVVPSTNITVKHDAFMRKASPNAAQKTKIAPSPNDALNSKSPQQGDRASAMDKTITRESSPIKSGSTNRRTPIFITEPKKTLPPSVRNSLSSSNSNKTSPAPATPATRVKNSATSPKSLPTVNKPVTPVGVATLAGEDVTLDDVIENDNKNDVTGRGYSMIMNMPALYKIQERKQQQRVPPAKPARAFVARDDSSDRSDSPDIIPENELNVFCGSDDEDEDGEHTVPQLDLDKLEKMERKLEKIEDKNKRLFKRSAMVAMKFVKTKGASKKPATPAASREPQQNSQQVSRSENVEKTTSRLPPVENPEKELSRGNSIPGVKVDPTQIKTVDVQCSSPNSAGKNVTFADAQNTPTQTSSQQLKAGLFMLSNKLSLPQPTKQQGNWACVTPPPEPTQPIIPNMEKVREREKTRQETLRRRTMYDHPIGLRGKRDDNKVVVSKADVRKLAGELVSQHEQEKASRRRREPVDFHSQMTLKERIRSFLTEVDQYCVSTTA